MSGRVEERKVLIRVRVHLKAEQMPTQFGFGALDIPI